MQVSNFRIRHSDKRRDLIRTSDCGRQGVNQVETLLAKDGSSNPMFVEHVLLEDRVRQHFKSAETVLSSAVCWSMTP
jgi:hypothetical protein